jgi:hypothetical protein
MMLGIIVRSGLRGLYLSPSRFPEAQDCAGKITKMETDRCRSPGLIPGGSAWSD